MLIRDIMTSHVKSVRPDATIQAAADMMSHFNVGVLPVCASEILIGILTDRDIVLRCIGKRLPPQHTLVSAIMTRHPVTVDAQCTIEAASLVMAREGFRRLPVTSDGNLVGLVTVDDIARCGDPLLIADTARRLASQTHAMSRAG